MNARELTHLAYEHIAEKDKDRALLISGDDLGDQRPSGDGPHISVTDRGTIFADPYGAEGRLIVRPPEVNSRTITIPFFPEKTASVSVAVDAAIAYLDAVEAAK